MNNGFKVLCTQLIEFITLTHNFDQRVALNQFNSIVRVHTLRRLPPRARVRSEQPPLSGFEKPENLSLEQS